MEVLIGKVLIPMLGIALTTIFGSVARKVGKQYDLEIEDTVITGAVMFAEEYARKLAKEKAGAISGCEKLEVAMQYVWDIIPETKKEAYRERLKKKIEAKVCELLHQPTGTE